MDLTILKSLIPLLLASIAGLIALVRLQSRSAENSKQLDMLTRDVSRLEKESTTTVTLVAKMDQAERNYVELWSKYDALDKQLIENMERQRDRQDRLYQDLRDRVNGNVK